MGDSLVGYAPTMPARTSRKTAPPPPDPAKLKREAAGRYVSGDRRFSVEQASGGWMVVDRAQTDDLGLPLVRGPFGTLDVARDAMTSARTDPAPASRLRERIARGPTPAVVPSKGAARIASPPPAPVPPEPPPIRVRPFRPTDGNALRELWESVGFGILGDDDRGLATFARRNPGMFVVATEGPRLVASAMGAWDGRRGWIHHLATTLDHRRSGLATQLVRNIEAQLLAIGCPKVNVLVRQGNREGTGFWSALGYEQAPSLQFARELSDED